MRCAVLRYIVLCRSSCGVLLLLWCWWCYVAPLLCAMSCCLLYCVCYVVFVVWCVVVVCCCVVLCYVMLCCVVLCCIVLYCYCYCYCVELNQSTHFPCRVAGVETQTCPYICLESVWRHWPSLPTIQHELDQRWAACWVGTLPCQPCSLSFRPLSPVPAVHRAERSHKEYETAPLRRIQIKY